MLPQTNARLLSISTGNRMGNWDKDGDNGTPIWSGNAGAYMMDKVTAKFNNASGDFDRIKTVTLIVPANLIDVNGNTIDLSGGEVIQYQFKGVTYQRKVNDTTGATLPSANVQEYIRLHLDPQAPEVITEVN